MNARVRIAATLGAVLVLGLAAGPSRAQEARPDTAAAGPREAAAARELVSRARDAAASSRHGEAASDYLDALALDPGLAPLVASELAYQNLWREDAGKAVFYFRRHLALNPDGDHREVRRGLALALSWDGRQPEAVNLYRELVEEDSADGAARVGLGRTLLWDNRLHEGFTVLRAVENEFPPEHAAGRESRDFLLTVLDGYTPHLEGRVEASWDSDDLDIHRVGASGAVTVFGNRLLQIMPRMSTYRLPGQPRVHGLRLRAGLVTALGSRWALHAYGWIDRFGSRAPLYGAESDLAWTRPGGDLWFTWLPAPRLRLDFGGTSQPVETVFALAREIGYDQANLSADYRLARRWMLGVAGERADYSDGNDRRKGTVKLTWRREGRWEIQAGPVLTYMEFGDPYPGGYWAPARVRSGALAARVATRLDRWTFKLDGSLGREQEAGSEAITVGGFSGRVGWRLHPDWLAALEAGHSRSSFATASGYRRTFASMSLRTFF